MSADSVVDAAIARAGATVNADKETSTTRLRFINLVIFTSPFTLNINFVVVAY
jgi:hypothetical protein